MIGMNIIEEQNRLNGGAEEYQNRSWKLYDVVKCQIDSKEVFGVIMKFEKDKKNIRCTIRRADTFQDYTSDIYDFNVTQAGYAESTLNAPVTAARVTASAVAESGTVPVTV